MFDPLTEFFIEEHKMQVDALNTLKEEVSKILVADYDFTVDEAEETITNSLEAYGSENMWNDNAIPADLAEFLASDENDD